jgi:hypothetical protein
MPKSIEDELKLDNWLSILTYDIARYAAAGGEVAAVYAMPDGALLIQLSGVAIEKVHSKFQKLLEQGPTSTDAGVEVD